MVANVDGNEKHKQNVEDGNETNASERSTQAGAMCKKLLLKTAGSWRTLKPPKSDVALPSEKKLRVLLNCANRKQMPL